LRRHVSWEAMVDIIEEGTTSGNGDAHKPRGRCGIKRKESLMLVPPLRIRDIRGTCTRITSVLSLRETGFYILLAASLGLEW
jgi:hypothetical protein